MFMKSNLVGIVALVIAASVGSASDAVALDVGGVASGAAGAAGDAASGAAGAAGSAAGGAAGAAGSSAGSAAAAGSAAVGSAVDGIGSAVDGIGDLGGQALGTLGNGSFGPSAVFGPEREAWSLPKAKKKAAKKKRPDEPVHPTLEAGGGSGESVRTRRMCSDILRDPMAYDQALVQLCRKVSSR